MTEDFAKWEERHPEENLPVPASPNAVVMMAMQKGYTPELIEKMMDLSERHEPNEARKAYHKAMSAFKAKPPKVWRDMQVKYGAGEKKQEWSHADLGTAADAISSALGEHGLNSSWRTKPQENGNIKVTCVVTHELGHSESTWLTAGPDTTGSKNAIQAIGSSVFYLERYTLFAITGLAPARMDDDGKTASNGKISKSEEWRILCDEAGACANSPEDMDAWWQKHGDTIKKELSKADAAAVYNQRIAHKKRLKAELEREPGSDDG